MLKTTIMFANLKIIFLFFTLSSIPLSCGGPESTSSSEEIKVEKEVAEPAPVQEKAILTGADQLDLYLPNLRGKKIAMVVNQTSKVGDQHLVDALLQQGILHQNTDLEERRMRVKKFRMVRMPKPEFHCFRFMEKIKNLQRVIYRTWSLLFLIFRM